MTQEHSSGARNAPDAPNVPVGDAASGSQSSDDDDWAWRRRIRANARSYLIYRIVVGVVGAAITVVGLVLIPAPGPGWLVVFLGLAVLASEFEWADRLLSYARHQVGRWTDWAARQSLPVRLLLGLATLVVLVAVLWTMLRVFGVPGFVPDSWVPAWSHLRS